MTNVCTKCGLPTELCVCQTIAKESQKVTIKIVKKKFGKKYTIIEGLDSAEVELTDLCKTLKNKLACGGTVKRNTIELQGDHKKHVKRLLVEQGFSAESIELQ